MTADETRPVRQRVLQEQYFHLGDFIDLDWAFLPVSAVMRLLLEIVIVAALIYVGWNRPFKE
jgi:hypothetical protein